MKNGTRALEIGSSGGPGGCSAQRQTTVQKDPRWALLDGGIQREMMQDYWELNQLIGFGSTMAVQRARQ
jgi:hypothetical protein